MKNESEQVQRWDDIIFEKRNKDYGAYAIRKSYDDNVLTGWVISLGVIAIIFLSSFLSINNEKPKDPEPKGGFTIIPPPDLKPVITPKSQPPPPAPRNTPANVPPAVVKHDVPDEPVAPVEPPTSGGVEGGTGQPQVGTPGGDDTGEPTIVEPPPAPEFYLSPEVAPAYEGGYEAMMQFLQRKLHYPSKARSKQIEGLVYVSFIISPSGAVTKVEVLKGIGHGCDEEAARVIAMMNKWKPGLMNKMAVPVKMVLPIKFKLSE